MEIPIIFEDEHIAVINKPAGIVVNDAATQLGKVTVQSWFAQRNPELFSKVTDAPEDFYNRNGVVHRIDKETSGVLILAKDEESFKNLQAQFKNRTVHKKYLAWTYGDFLKSKIGEEVEVNAPIARNPKKREKFAIVEDGKPASTKFKLVDQKESKEGETLSLIECEPKTGRTHQIRVHLTALGNPVIGDKLYSGKKHIRRDKNTYERQYLHASHIEFEHPVTNEKLKFDAPMPQDMQELC